jgi:alkylation response protein AidB-like acyl-CoA dehydrogenase
VTEPHADDAGFRQYVRRWFAENTPANWRAATPALDEAGQLEWQRDWLRTLSGVGFHAPHVPKEFGGGGYDLMSRAIIYEEWARAEAPALLLYSVSLHHMPSTLLNAGTQEQKDKYVRDGISGVVWCQGFSESEAGSDLAALRTTAVYSTERGGYVVNGRKIWSSHAAHASYCLLLARTSSDGPKQQGITYFIADMSSPGIATHPIVQSTGDKEFCEVTFDDVFIPEADRIGAEGQGWQIAQSTLSAERGPLALEIVERIDVARRGLRRELRDGGLGGGFGTDPARADDDAVVAMSARSLALSCMAHDMIGTILTSGRPSSLSSVVKVASSDLMRAVVDHASLYDGVESMVAHPLIPGTSWFSGHWFTDFIHSWAWSIGAGSNEIQRNIIADRVLGMPRTARAR